MTVYYVSFAIVIAVQSAIAVWYAKRWLKVTSVILFVALLIGAPFVYFDTLSRPKLLTDETRKDERVTILNYHYIEGKAVYYLLQLPDVEEPRYYFEPWSKNAEKRASDMADGTASDPEGEMTLAHPFEPSLDEDNSGVDINVWAIDPPKVPPKPIVEFIQ